MVFEYKTEETISEIKTRIAETFNEAEKIETNVIRETKPKKGGGR